jgi:hypothetical protein
MRRRRIPVLAFALCAAVGAGCSSISLRTPESRRYFAQFVTDRWSNDSRLQAARLMDEHGPPDKIGHAELVWNDKGAWKRIRVWDATPYYDSSAGAPNLEQTVSYPVLPERRAQLAALGGKLRVSRDGQELSARGASEAANLLTLNLADEIVAGRRSPKEASRFYDRTIELSVSGKSSPYLERLLFTPLPVPAGEASGRAR